TGWSTSTAPSARPRASRPPTTPATRSTKPRSCTGADAPTVPRAQPAIRRNHGNRRKTTVSDRGSESESPVIPAPTPKPTRPRTNRDWWPNQLDLQVLHQHSPVSNPMGADFDYAEGFKTLDVDALRRATLWGL